MLSRRYLFGFGALGVAVVGLVTFYAPAKPGMGPSAPAKAVPVLAKAGPEPVVTWVRAYKISDGVPRPGPGEPDIDRSTSGPSYDPVYADDDPQMGGDEKRLRERIRSAAEDEVKKYLTANRIAEPCLMEQPESTGTPDTYYMTGKAGAKAIMVTVGLDAHGKPEWADVTRKRSR